MLKSYWMVFHPQHSTAQTQHWDGISKLCLFPQMTVEESLSFLLDIWNIDTSECEAKVKYALDERLLGMSVMNW